MGSLTEAHMNFFRKWDRLLTLEENDASSLRREIWAMSGKEREKLKRYGVFSSIFLTDTDALVE